ncbi:hypothetical protein C0Q70_21409 [Pomacea canaliculata]|uniref:von Willebrand factor D and EGF domain-containing protein n=1 Tax=Pomacea canaliculata TaxID=400727 RepID=A0A2T7NCI5_POMCA|nr:hypothetical protein C0Q70_21409 [Pomacea canaliculata]
MAAVFAWAAGCECEVDPCLPNCYTELADTHRSVGYTAQYPLTPLCDISLQSGWYRFANGMMPEICVPRFHCGTIVPVWMAGKHPNEEEGIVARKACANFETGGEQSNPCCEHSVQIAVKNCGDFFVYYLQPTPACPVAYCAGTSDVKQPCPANKWSATGFEPCTDAYPKIDTDPVLKGPEVTNNSFRFSCEIPAQNNDPNQMFEVVWTFDGHVDSAIPSTVLKSTDHVAYLPGSSLKGHMGTNVGCKVRTYYSGRNVTSPWLDSNTYWAGIRTNPPSLQISEKEEIRNVTLTSTIPIVCDHNYTCCLTVKLDVDGPKSQVKKNLMSGCVYANVCVCVLQIKVLDVPTKSCSLVGDPHITSLESSRPYDMFKIGDYTMYQNPKRDFEMQVRTWPCGHVSCVCGVVIREKNDVIRVDECDQPYAGHHTSPKVEVYSKPLREGTVIQRSTDGHEVTVNLPSSTEVKVTAADYGLDVHLLAPPVDSGEARGLCGTFDGNPNNEFTHRDGHVDPVCHYCPRPDSFTDSWRNNRSTSLFESLPVKVSDNYEASYCTCDKGTNNDVIANCASRGAIPNTVMKCQACSNITNLAPIFGGNIGGWTRRSAPAYNDVDEPDPRFNPEDHKDFQPGNPTWPTPSGITQQQAHTKCLETLHGSQIWTHCQGSQDIVDTYLQNCVADTLGILSSFTTECQMELSRDPNNYVTSPDGKLMMKPEISTDICSAICLRHGRCNRGQCICDTGYEGDNCHLLAGVGPQLARVRSSNVCDINERPCRKVFIDATNIALTDQLMCRVQEVLPDGSVSHDAFIQEGHFLSSGRLACALPDARIKSGRYPTMTPPTLSGPDADFILTCTLHSDDVSSSARFEVTWYVNDQRQKSETLYGAARESTYNLPDMPTTSGKVYCMARSFYRDVSVFSGYLTSEAKMVQKHRIIECGTVAPVWMYGGHPGDQEVCPAGKWSDSGSPPCRDVHPKLRSEPVLKGPIVNGSQFEFTCTIDFPDVDPDARFDVMWTFDGKEDDVIGSTVLSDPDRVAHLNGSALKGHMGTEVGCKVRSYYFGSSLPRSPWLSSNTYWAGIRTDPPVLQISEAAEELTNIRLTSTIPIICNFPQDCSLTVKLHVDGTANNAMANICQYKIPAVDGFTDVQVVAKKDLINDGDKDLLLSFEPMLGVGVGGPYLSAFEGYRPQTTKVTVKDVGTKTCSWQGDPHIQGFESNRKFNLYRVGDYTMYENPSRAFEIQARTWPCCSMRVTCVCGVVIREVNDVIRIDQCDQRYGNPHTSPIIKVYNGPLREGTSIQRSRDGSRITVNLPSGTGIIIRHQNYGLDVDILASSVDQGKGRGVCGTFDGNPFNELTHRSGFVDRWSDLPEAFTQSWLKSGQESLFKYIPAKITDPYTVRYCSCDTGNRVNCTPAPVSPNTGVPCPGCPPAPYQQVAPAGGKRSLTDADTDEPEAVYDPDNFTDFVPGNATWPTPSGITEEQARTKCQLALTSSQLWTHCQDKEKVDNFIENCVTDIEFGDTFEFADSYRESFETDCQLELSRDPRNYVTSATGELEMKPELSTDICSTKCLLHGTCNKGQCVCESGYTGDNCHLLAGKGPQLSRIRNSNICDVNERPCRKIFIDVSNIDLADRLTCRVQEVLIYLISASNDGHMYGNQLNLTVYDSRCQACDGVSCRQKVIDFPVITAVSLTRSPDNRMLLCTISSGDVKPTASYRVTWAVDGVWYREMEVSRGQLQVVLVLANFKNAHEDHRAALGAAQDPCQAGNYQELNDAYRSVKYMFSYPKIPECDVSLTRAWYRFTGPAGDMMPETCIPRTHCGTQAPVWINGTHPDVTEGIVQRTSCANYGSDRPLYGPCCDIEIDIEIKNCGSFYVYHLSPTDSCPIRDKDVCTQDQWSLDGMPPCKEDPDNMIEVLWTVNGNNTWKKLFLDPDRVAYLDGSFLKAHLGSTTEPSRLEISEKEELRNVLLTSTIPILCSSPRDGGCCLSLRLDVEGSRQNLVTAGDCEYKLCARENVSDSASVNIPLMAVRDLIDDGDVELLLSFQVIQAEDGDLNPLVFEGYRALTTNITVRDVEIPSCSWTGDSHVHGFESSLSFNLYNVGDYTMYENPSRAFEIQARTWPCNGGNVTCVCGIAIRELNEIIRIDQCDQPYGSPHTSPLVTVYSQPLRDGTVILRSSDGSKIVVNLPSGTGISVDARRWGLNVHLLASPVDEGKGRGVCGTFDGDPLNEFTHRNGYVDSSSLLPINFTESWRNNKTQSLFKSLPPKVIEPDATKYCSCDTGSGDVTRSNCTSRRHVSSAAFNCPNCPDITDRLTVVAGGALNATDLDEQDARFEPDNFTACKSNMADIQQPDGRTVKGQMSGRSA